MACNVKEDRIQAAAVREEQRHKDKARYDDVHEEERQRVDAEFSEVRTPPPPHGVCSAHACTED